MKIFFLIPLFLFSNFSYGENAASEDLFALTLEDLMIIKVSGATLTEQSLKDVPSSVTVFNHEQINQLGLDYLHELMGQVPGFQSFRSSYSPQLSSFSSRGRTIGGLGAEVLLIVDGQRIDEPRTSGSIIIGGKIPLVHIERVEFIRGPGSAVYGSNAMLGVVNIITRKSQNEIAVAAGSFQKKQAHLFASHQEKELKINLFTRAEEDQGDDFNVPSTYTAGRIDTSDPIEVRQLNFNLTFKDTHINMQHYQSHTEDFYMFGTIANGVNESDSQFDSLSIKQDFNLPHLHSWLRISEHQSKYFIAGQLSPEGAFSGSSNPDSSEALLTRVDLKTYKEQQIQWHSDWQINPLRSLQFGLDFRQLDAPEVIAQNNFDLADIVNQVDPIRYYGELLATTPIQKKSQRDILGLYSQYQQIFQSDSQLTLGLRYDRFSSIGEKISPRIAWVQALNKEQSIKVLYGEAFRAPAENELNLLNNTVILGDPELKSESVQSWEVIYLFQDSQHSFSSAYFENHYEDSIQRTLISGNVFKFSNIDQDPVKGLEFEFAYQLTNHWLMRSSYTHFLELPTSSFREAEKLGSLTVNYHHAYWNANLSGHYLGKRHMSTAGSDDNLVSLDAYWLWFAKMNYQVNRRLDSYIQIKNLANKYYQSAPYNANQTEGIPNRDRQILVGLNWQF